jgi:hypothetical protein
MKKIYFVIMALAALTFASCEKEPIGGTAVQALSGVWVVHVDGYDTVGDSIVVPFFNFEEKFTEGHYFQLLTYNNAANEPNKLFVDDQESFWQFKVLADCDLNTLSFGSKDTLDNVYYPCGVALTNGKIVKNGAKTPSGMPADYIQFDVNFDDDDLADYGLPGVSYGDYYGFDVYRVSGWRYTGFASDEVE